MVDGNLLENQRIQRGAESRSKLELKYRLAEDPRYEEAKRVQREVAINAIHALKETSSPDQFGRELDARVVQVLVDKFGGENGDSYGFKLKAAFLERIGEKARDEISAVVTSLNIEPSTETRRLLDLLPFGQSAEAIGETLGKVVASGELSTLGTPQRLFERARDAKIKESEEFLKQA